MRKPFAAAAVSAVALGGAQRLPLNVASHVHVGEGQSGHRGATLMTVPSFPPVSIRIEPVDSNPSRSTYIYKEQNTTCVSW